MLAVFLQVRESQSSTAFLWSLGTKRLSKECRAIQIGTANLALSLRDDGFGRGQYSSLIVPVIPKRLCSFPDPRMKTLVIQRRALTRDVIWKHYRVVLDVLQNANEPICGIDSVGKIVGGSTAVRWLLAKQD